MNAATIITELKRRGVEIVADGDRLRFRPVSAVDMKLRAAMHAQKPALLRLLAVPVSNASPLYDVPAGWSRERWIIRLRQLAAYCQSNVPDRAAELREWADGLQRERMERK